MSPAIKGRGKRPQRAHAFACAHAGAFATPDDQNRWGQRCKAQCPSCRIWADHGTRYVQTPGQGGRYVKAQ